MLLLADASTIIFLKFLQILLWVSIPAFLIGMLITTLLHYKNKRKKKNETPSLLVESNGRLISGYDDSSLIPQRFYLPSNKNEVNGIIHQLFHSKARYLAIRRDYEVLTKKFQKMHVNVHSNSGIIKQETMETIHADTRYDLTEHIQDIKQQYELEKKQLHSELTQLNSAYENLEKDNANLHEQLNAYSHDDTKVTAVLNKWELEKAELKKKLTEQEYLKDVLEEKKLQITFLQQQLEQRIKNHHLVEQQFRDLGVKFMEVKEELEIKQQSEKDLQTIVHDKEQEISSLKEMIQAKTDLATGMESSLKELQERSMNFSLTEQDNSKLITQLRDELALSNENKNELEQKLEKSQNHFKGLHRKLADILEEDIAKSPVIIMTPIFTGESEQELSGSAIQ